MSVYFELEHLREKRLSCIKCAAQRANDYFQEESFNYIITTVFANSFAFHSVTDS